VERTAVAIEDGAGPARDADQHATLRRRRRRVRRRVLERGGLLGIQAKREDLSSRDFEASSITT
jgi:hypothetical protein